MSTWTIQGINLSFQQILQFVFKNMTAPKGSIYYISSFMRCLRHYYTSVSAVPFTTGSELVSLLT